MLTVVRGCFLEESDIEMEFRWVMLFKELMGANTFRRERTPLRAKFIYDAGLTTASADMQGTLELKWSSRVVLYWSKYLGLSLFTSISQ